MHEPTDAGELADRYRRLLAWYPRDHRERHGEEMLGVLLAGAGARPRPSRKEKTDLLLGAARLHLRRVAGLDGGIEHRDVLAIVSLLGPIVMLAGAASTLDTVAGRLRVGVPPWFDWAYELPDAPVWPIWFVVAVLSFFRLRRSAAALAWLGTLALLLSAAGSILFLGQFVPTMFSEQAVLYSGWLVLGALVAAALTWSPGPARGWELVGGRGVAVSVVSVGASVAMVVGSLNTYGVLFFPMSHVSLIYGTGRLVLWLLALVVLAVGALLAADARTRTGRRAASVLCVPAAVSALMIVLPTDGDLLIATVVCYGLPVVVLVGLGSLPRRTPRRVDPAG